MASKVGQAEGSIPETHRKTCEAIKAVTGATEEEIFFVLRTCNYDANEATTKLLDSPFETFKSKAKKKSDAKKAKPKTELAESKRPISGGRDLGSRGGRGDRGGGGGYGGSSRGGYMGGDPSRDGGYRSRPPVSATAMTAPVKQGLPWSQPGAMPAEVPATRAPLYNRTGSGAPASAGDGWDAPQSSVPSAPTVPSTIRPPIAVGSGRSVADVLKGTSGQPSYSTQQPAPPSDQGLGQSSAPDSAAPVFDSFLSSSHFQAQDNLPKGMNAWSAKPKTAMPHPSASTAQYNGHQAEVEAFHEEQTASVAASLAEIQVSDENIAAMPPSMQSAGLQFGDFGGDFGDFGAGFGPDPNAFAATANASPMSSFVQPAAPAQPKDATQRAPPSAAPRSKVIPASMGMEPPAGFSAPQYYGGMGGPQYPYLGQPGAYGNHSFEPADQGSDVSRLSKMQHAGGPGAQGGLYYKAPSTSAPLPAASTAQGADVLGSKSGGKSLLNPQPPNAPPSLTQDNAQAGYNAQYPPSVAHLPMHAAYTVLPPGMAPGTQYSPMYPAYPYMPTNYVHNPYSHYPMQPTGAAYAAQPGSTPGAVVGSNYAGGQMNGGLY